MNYYHIINTNKNTKHIMYEQNELFQFEDYFTQDDNPIDKTQITTTILYLSENELKEFKKYVKQILKIKYPNNYKEKNYSDLILQLIKNEYNNCK